MRGDLILATAMAEKFYLHPSMMSSLQDFMSKGLAVDLTSVNNTSNNSTTMQIAQDKKGRGNIAIINIDGGMYKKDMSGMCMSVCSYQKIQQHINDAEEMFSKGEISKAIFRVTTPGGAVHGVDALENQVSNMKIPTVTFAEDMICSAGIYAFMATDRVVAAPMTEIGSIGVVSQFIKNKDQEVITITSSRASNKRLDLTKKEDQEKYRKELDVYEERFYNVVEKNTGFSASQIEEEFDNGGTIFADKALEIGFVDEVLRFEDFLEKEFNTLGGNTTAMPTASSGKLANNSNERKSMTEEEIVAMQQQNKVFSARIATLETREKNLVANLEDTTKALDDAKASMESTIEAKLSEAVVSFKGEAETRVREAVKCGANEDTIVAMLNAEDSDEASKLLLDLNQSDGGTQLADAKQNKDAWADFENKN